MIQPKLKRCAGCDQDKVIWKAHGKEKYCRDCWYQMTPQKRLESRTPIRPVSKKMQKNLSEYDKKRTAFLALHPYCQAKIPGCMGPASEIHHKAGRIENLNKISTWLAVCRYCHHWIEHHPEAAKELGFSESRLELKETNHE